MSFRGSLEDVSVADLLQFIHLGQRSGTLRLEQAPLQAQIGFHHGRLVSAWASQSPRLGERLRDSGVITQATLDAALSQRERERPRPPLGQVLIRMNALTAAELKQQMERHIEQTVYTLVGWAAGSFEFAIDDLEPIDDIGLYPGDIVPQVDLNTQMVVLESMRILDERNRAGASSPPKTTPVIALPARVKPATVEAAGRQRVQVIGSDPRLALALARALEPSGIALSSVALRDAGAPAPDCPPPLVVFDLRDSALSLEHMRTFRRTRPRVLMVAVQRSTGTSTAAFHAGALAVLPPEPETIASCVRSLLASQLEPSSARVSEAGYSRLRRMFGELRSGLLSATISLNLMSTISESVERAVMFLVKRRSLVALGAFGLDGAGRPLADRTRGLVLDLADNDPLCESVSDGQTRALRFGEAPLPPAFTRVIDAPRNGRFVVFPVLGAQRVIAVIYADNGQVDAAIEETDLLELAVGQVGLAFENELLRRQVASAG